MCNKSQTITDTCPKCQGAGHIPGFEHVHNGVCFQCRGAGSIEYTVQQYNRKYPKYVQELVPIIEGMLWAGQVVHMYQEDTRRGCQGEVRHFAMAINMGPSESCGAYMGTWYFAGVGYYDEEAGGVPRFFMPYQGIETIAQYRNELKQYHPKYAKK